MPNVELIHNDLREAQYRAAEKEALAERVKEEY